MHISMIYIGQVVLAETLTASVIGRKDRLESPPPRGHRLAWAAIRRGLILLRGIGQPSSVGRHDMAHPNDVNAARS
jgi:hypothetical protein